ACADLDVFRKRAGLHLPIQRRAAETGAIEDGIEAKDAVGSVGHGLILSALLWLLASRIGITVDGARGRKDQSRLVTVRCSQVRDRSACAVRVTCRSECPMASHACGATALCAADAAPSRSAAS